MNKNDIKQYLKRLQEIDEQLNSNELDGDIFNEIDEIIKSIDAGIKETTTVSTQFTLPVKIKKFHHDAVVPEYAKHGDAGLDFRATRIIDENDDQITYGTDLSLEIPHGYVGLIFPRSSIRKYDLNLSNSVGVIDCVPKGTKIKTINGDINVEEIFNNQSIPIYSYNEEKNDIEIDDITDIWVVENMELLKITTEDDDTIELPLEKEVFTMSGWKKVKDLTESDKILRFF